MIQVVTTVTVPANSYDLVTLDVVKSDLNITSTTDDAFLSRAISQASLKVSQFCNRVFQVETLIDLLYPPTPIRPLIYPGPLDKLQLSRWPITSMSSVVVDTVQAGQTTLTANTDYKAITRTGQLLRLDYITGLTVSWEPVPITVTYSAGYATIPVDIVEATSRMVASRYFSRDRDPALRTIESPSVGSKTYWVGGPPSSGGMPQEIADMLTNYRVPVVA